MFKKEKKTISGGKNQFFGLLAVLKWQCICVSMESSPACISSHVCLCFDWHTRYLCTKRGVPSKTRPSCVLRPRGPSGTLAVRGRQRGPKGKGCLFSDLSPWSSTAAWTVCWRAWSSMVWDHWRAKLRFCLVWSWETELKGLFPRLLFIPSLGGYGWDGGDLRGLFSLQNAPRHVGLESLPSCSADM